jgi:hypothetical protein
MFLTACAVNGVTRAGVTPAIGGATPLAHCKEHFNVQAATRPLRAGSNLLLNALFITNSTSGQKLRGGRYTSDSAWCRKVHGADAKCKKLVIRSRRVVGSSYLVPNYPDVPIIPG